MLCEPLSPRFVSYSIARSADCLDRARCGIGLRAQTHRVGRHVYAVMDDPDAAELSGVNVKMMLITVYAISDLICAFAGWALIIGAVAVDQWIRKVAG